MRGCDCPQDGTWFCATCQAYLARVQGHPASHREEPERAFQAKLRRAALDLGLLYFHTYDSRRSDAGWPDTAICDPMRRVLYLWELKRTGGKPTKEQVQWLSALGHVRRVETGLYYPEDWPVMLAQLTRRD